MRIQPLRKDLQSILDKHNLKNKYLKQALYLKVNQRHRSLHFEKLEPKELNLYSFRIVDINPHYYD